MLPPDEDVFPAKSAYFAAPPGGLLFVFGEQVTNREVADGWLILFSLYLYASALLLSRMHCDALRDEDEESAQRAFCR